MTVVDRAGWGARPPKRTPVRIDLPTAELWLHHTAGSEPDGPEGVRRIQNYHMEVKGWADIAYSFVIDRTGTVFEGRGAGVRGGHTRGRNSVSHAICVMGNYDTEAVPAASFEAVAGLIAHGARQGWWPGRLSGGHRDAPDASTSCPGRNLYARIADLNIRAARLLEAAVVEPILYARRGTPDLAVACAAMGAAGRGSVTCDLRAAAAALDNGADVLAVGGPASRELPNAVAVFGDSALKTMAAVAEHLTG